MYTLDTFFFLLYPLLFEKKKKKNNKYTAIKKTLLISLIIFILINACSSRKNHNYYLEKVLNNLDQIKSATYFSTMASYAPGDTSPLLNFQRYFKEYSNPPDTFVGSSFVMLLKDDTTKMDFCYDGNMRARVNWDEKYMEIDSFQNNPLPFRPINAPFFTRTKRLIKYALETEDSIAINYKDFGDSIQYSFFIYDTVVEIIGNRIVYTPSLYGTHKGDVSRYYLWINKSDNLPYKFKRDMPHDVSIEICKNAMLNKGNIKDFVASKYFPNYPLKTRKSRTTVKNDLIGKIAPNWILKDTDNNSYALEKFKSKVLMIEFTSVSCGPCLMSIPFLKQLSSEYDKKDFDFVSIESFNRNPTVLKRYQDRNYFNYKFLISTKEVTRNYQIQAIPVFYILNENRDRKSVV